MQVLSINRSYGVLEGEGEAELRRRQVRGHARRGLQLPRRRPGFWVRW